MPIRKRGTRGLLRIRTGNVLRKMSNRVNSQSDFGKRVKKSLRLKAKKLIRSKPNEKDLAIDLRKLEIDETEVIEFLEWVKKLKRQQKLKHFLPFQRFMKKVDFSDQPNRVLFIIPPLHKFQTDNKVEFPMSQMTAFHSWVRDTTNPVVAKARQYRHYFYVSPKAELVFTNDQFRSLAILVPPVPEKERRSWEMLWSSKGRAPPLVFARPSQFKIIRPLASGKHLFEVYFYDPYHTEFDRQVKAEYFDD